MRYGIYISKGYPLGSGIVEGACKNLVKDRMEQCGMRWSIAGAEAFLGMRSIKLNGGGETHSELLIGADASSLWLYQVF